MTLPLDYQSFAATMDPTDVVDFLVRMTGTTLESGESVSSYTLEPSAEFTALGGLIMTGGGRDAAIVDGVDLLFWVEFEEESELDASFDGSGVTLGLTITIVTNNIPSRTKQRTIAIKAAQR